MSKYVCDRCKDTHLMYLDDRKVLCIFCPLPCPKCRQGGLGSFCEETPCSCECHKEPPIEGVSPDMDRSMQIHPAPKKKELARADMVHPNTIGMAHWVDEKPGEGVFGDEFKLVYGETAQEAKEKARDRLLIALARALRVTSHEQRDELLRAARALEETL